MYVFIRSFPLLRNMSNTNLNNDLKDPNKQVNQFINKNNSSSSNNNNNNNNSNTSSKNKVRIIESLHTFDIYNTDPYPSLQNTSSPDNTDISLKEQLSLDPSTQDFLPRGLKSIHGTTKRVVDAKNSFKRWDWNKLPSKDAKCLKSISNYNLINIEIDGQIKQLQYLSSYNPMLPVLDFFMHLIKNPKPLIA